MSTLCGPTQRLVLACFDSDDVGVAGADGQRGLQPGGDVLVGHVSVQQQHLDQFAGARAVAVGLAGSRPERLVGGGERPAGPGLHQRGGAGQRAGLEAQHLQVVVQDQHPGAFAAAPFMPDDFAAALEHDELVGAQRHPDPAVDEPCRH